MDKAHLLVQQTKSDSHLLTTEIKFFIFLSQKQWGLAKIWTAFIEFLMMIAFRIILSSVNLHKQVHCRSLVMTCFEQGSTQLIADNLSHIQDQ